MNRKKQHSIIFAFAGAILLGSASWVQADAWWGEGYRPTNWVLLNGGTIISYEIVGGKKSSSHYKARLTRAGEYVEVEFGRSGTFDDAKDGAYQINFYTCKNCADQKNNKKEKVRDKDEVFASTTVLATPGKNCRLTANADTGVVQQSCSGGKPRVPLKSAREIAMEEVSKNLGEKTEIAFAENDRLNHFLIPFFKENDTLRRLYYEESNLVEPHSQRVSNEEDQSKEEEG